MSLSHRQIIDLPVFTKSGQRLGYIIRFDLDELEQKISRYYVKTHQGIVGLFDQELSIAPKQVISLNHEKMVVDDAIVEAAEKRSLEATSKNPLPINN